jgi:branched-chain amino acid aminotransferase
MTNVDTIAWIDGELIPVREARISLLSHALHYGTGIFEGIRCYPQPGGGGGVFRLREHMDRLVLSGRVVGIDVPFESDELCVATLEVLKTNGMSAGYVRPLAWLGEGAMGVAGGDNPVHTAILAWEWGRYLGEKALEEGIRVAVTGHERPTANAAPVRAKVTGLYVASFMAKRVALAMGVSEALVLDRDGYLAEGSGENLFVVANGELVTPPDESPILHGITRATVVQLAEDLGIPVRFARIARGDLHGADEAFLTGTAAELTPIREVDGRALRTGRGPVTAELQAAFLDAVHGRGPRSTEWVTPLE